MSRRAYANELPRVALRSAAPDHVSVALTHDTSSSCRAEPLFGAMFVMFGESSVFESVNRTMCFGDKR